MRENLYRLWLLAIVILFVILTARNVFGAPKKEKAVEPKKPVVLTISPRKSFTYKETALTIHLTVDRHDKNLAATLEWGSDIGNEGSTFIQLDEHSPATYEKLWEFPVGYYNFRACVFRTVKPTKVCVEEEAEIVSGEPP